MRSRPTPRFNRATSSRRLHVVRLGDVQRWAQLVLRGDIQRPRKSSIPPSGTAVLFDWTGREMPTVKPFTSRPSRCRTVFAPEWLQHWDPFATRRKRRPGRGTSGAMLGKLDRWPRRWPQRPVRYSGDCAFGTHVQTVSGLRFLRGAVSASRE